MTNKVDSEELLGILKSLENKELDFNGAYDLIVSARHHMRQRELEMNRKMIATHPDANLSLYCEVEKDFEFEPDDEVTRLKMAEYTNAIEMVRETYVKSLIESIVSGLPNRNNIAYDIKAVEQAFEEFRERNS